MADHIVEFESITKKWGNFVGLNNLSLQVRRGEILTLLGPSGCGKSTLMRIVAGFESPTAGRVVVNGKVMGNTPPERRPVNMVFQRYALFPHLDLFDNVAFPLRLQKLPKDVIHKRVEDMLDLVQVRNLANRWVSEVSGGQAQRIALARALINKPEVLLLDEPLSALDLKIRHYMLDELKRIHRETSTTFIYVTHDQDEAMVLSDRIVLMNGGRIEQMGTPDEMYSHPKTLFCAKFFGDTNLLTGKLADGHVETPLGRIVAPICDFAPGTNVTASIRPEAISLAAPTDEQVQGTVLDVTSKGDRLIYQVVCVGEQILKCQALRTATTHIYPVGTSVGLSWQSDDVVLLQA